MRTGRHPQAEGVARHVSDIRICDLPDASDFVRFRSGFGRRFMVTVDTEEEFDWSAPLDRHRHSIAAIPALGEFQRFCEEFGVVPVYLVDYPIASAPQAREALGEAVAAGRAEIGVQLHPWVNPPFEEAISEYNSFAGNLPRELERAKFQTLRDEIERNFGVAPRIFRCGRYGAGIDTADILIEGGIAIDTSVRARFDYSAVAGPNYREHPVRPYWLDRDAGLLELPLTTTYWGPLHRYGHWLYPRLWRLPQLRGLLARLGLLERIPLTPEGVSPIEAIRGIDMAIEEDLPVLVLSFHSPSLAPGYTPYVRTADDLARFYDWWQQIFAYLAQRGIAPTGVAALLEAVELASPGAAG